MNYEDFEKIISKPRLDRYLEACSGSKVRAKRLYRANLRLAESFYPVLNLFEVILRNTINEKVAFHFKDPNWIMVQKNGFMGHGSLKPSQFYLKNQIEKAEKTLKRRRIKVSAGKVIAEQTFGFWTSLFEPHHYALLKGTLIKAFPNKPKSANRVVVATKLQGIRELRNRIYHNEPVCFQGRIVGLNKSEKVHDDIRELLLWMGNNHALYVAQFDKIKTKLELIKNV